MGTRLTVLTLLTVGLVQGQIFSEDFNAVAGLTLNPKSQVTTGHDLGHKGRLAGWSHSGQNALHMVETADGNWAMMIWQDNVITSSPIAGANKAGQEYRIDFLAAGANYKGPRQVNNGTSDGLKIEVLRAKDDLSFTQIVPKPIGPGKLGLKPYSFTYRGNGSGDIKLRVGPKNPNQGRFQGSIDELSISSVTPVPVVTTMPEHFETYCLDCHDDLTKKGDLDLLELFDTPNFDGTWAFENLITGKMPPANKKQPSAAEKQQMLTWLANSAKVTPPADFRRLSRHEFVHSVNDLLGVSIDLTDDIPEDRGTYDFDTDRRIQLGKEQLTAYFQAAEDMLEFAFPANGFHPEQTWHSKTLKPSLAAFRKYKRPYEDGILFSWTRSNNSRNYGYFYDGFEPPEPGWYELTFEAAKRGDFPEDISVSVLAGKYYVADDRPERQRMLGVISLGSKQVKPHRMTVFLNPGESISVHCQSKHTWRQANGNAGAYIRQFSARGPVHQQWPPRAYRQVFAGLPITAQRSTRLTETRTVLERIGGSITPSGVEHAILQNPQASEIVGLSYSDWAGDEGSGYITDYAIRLSEDGKTWGDAIVSGRLIANFGEPQPIAFPAPSTAPFIKFEVLGKVAGAKIGALDVQLPPAPEQRDTVSVSGGEAELKQVIARFAQRAFADEVAADAYQRVSLDHFRAHGDFVAATKVGLKAIVCSHRFLLTSQSADSAHLARTLWLSVPDSATNNVSAAEIAAMLVDPRSARMVRSFCAQWLNLRSLNTISPSPKLYPTFNELVNFYLPRETEAYFAHLIAENLPIGHLIDADFAFLNQRLAQHYDIPGIYGQELRKVKLPADSPRGGLMTMASVLKVTADGFHTSPILRGAWISKNIVGTTLSPPPEEVEVIEPDHSEGKTLREQIEAHKTSKACYACHKSIDPYGFALESFDPTGKWRDRYRLERGHSGTFMYSLNGHFSPGATVDPAGEIGDVEFADVRGLKALLLADHKKLAYNLAKTFFEYAKGYEPSLQQRLDLYALIPEKAEDCGVRDLLVDVLAYGVRQR
jgi:hypothetical protein